MTRKGPDSKLPSDLERAVQDKQLLVFAGSGISMLSPSLLPNWWQFNKWLLHAAKNSALEVKGLDERAQEAINGLSLEDVGVASQSEAIVKIMAGKMYFPVLQVLDCDRTNANHTAIAELASRGIVRAIVTTNFDTLIERAFYENNVPLKVAVSVADFVQPRDPNICALYKIHGSVTQTSTLVDTVGQKMRGLPPYTRQRLAELFEQLYVLVVGYSGKDLEFGFDYLALSAIDRDTPGIRWIEREDSSDQRSALVTRIVKRAGPKGGFYQASLPGFFGQLGATLVQEDSNKSSKAAPLADETAQVTIEAFFKERGSRAALALCMRLLLDSGKFDAAVRVRTALTSAIEKLGDQLEEQDGPVLRALAVTASPTEGISGLRRWTLREISYLEERFRQWQATSEAAKASFKNGQEPTPLPRAFPRPMKWEAWLEVDREVVTEIERLQSGAWSNLSLERASAADVPGASQAVIRSMDFAELAASPIELAGSYLTYGMGLLQLKGNLQAGFNWLTFAEAAGVIAGNVDAANAAALLRARGLFAWGEYDAAVAALDRVQSRLPLGVDRRNEVEVERLAGCIANRRGQLKSAMASWKRALEIARAAKPLNIYVRCAMLSELAHIPSQRLSIIRECDEIAQMMKDGIIPSNGQVDGIPSLQHIESWQKLMREQAPLKEPFFLRDLPPPEDPVFRVEFELRGNLLRAEFFQHDLIIVQCLSKLLHHTYQMGAGERALELVEALRIAGKRAGDFSAELQADWYAANILYGLGDADGARKALQGLDRIQFAADPAVNARVTQMLARINSEPIPRLSTNVIMQRIVNGERALPTTPQEFESLAEGAIDAGELAPARILCLAAISAYRLVHDNMSVARCFELLAKAAGQEGRTVQAEALKQKART